MGYFIGLMSGTSMDAIDAAVLEIDGDRHRLVAKHSQPIPPELHKTLLSLNDSETFHVVQFGALDVALGEAFAEAARQVLLQNQIRMEEISAIGSHGQTLFHSPVGRYPFTLQIGDPNVIAQKTGITTIADFRRRDMAAGGQGAPLTPAFHNVAFRSERHERAILNIGGIANITLLPADPGAPVIGFDTGPGNCLLDSNAQRHLDLPMDRDGRWARGGRVSDQLLEQMLGDDYFALAPPKSTGREYFSLRWLYQYGRQYSPHDIQATACQLTIESIARAIERYAASTEELYVCGGGVYNPVLMQGLEQRLNGIRVTTTEALGISPDWVEAATFAWLAQQTLAAKAGNLTSVTGAKEAVILGAIYPGRNWHGQA